MRSKPKPGKRGKVWKIVFGVIIVPLIALEAYNLINSWNYEPLTDDPYNKHFYEKLEAALSQRRERIQLSELTNFEWSQVCIREPYYWYEERAEDSGIQYKNSPQNVVNDDTVMSLEFLNGKDAVIIYMGMFLESERLNALGCLSTDAVFISIDKRPIWRNDLIDME